MFSFIIKKNSILEKRKVKFYLNCTTILELTKQHAMAYNLQKEILGKPVEMQGRKVRSLK